MLRIERHTRFWLLTFAIALILIWSMKGILLPFIAGMIIAYFLDPAVEALTNKKIPRWLGALIVMIIFGLAITTLFLLITPLVHSQANALLHAAPIYAERLNSQWIPQIQSLLSPLGVDDASKLQEAAGQSVGEAAGFAGTVMKKVISSSMAVVDILTLLIITPIVAFFMMLDWPKVKQTVDDLIPRRYYAVLREQFQEIDTILSGFIRGQALVCMTMAAYYSIALSLTGLPYSFAIGILTGILTFIPMVGTLFGWIMGLSLAAIQFDGWQPVAMTAGVFLAGNVLENYFVTPKLVGDRIGLHPLWIMFALFVGGSWLGFSGVLIAMPAAAVIGVVTRFLIRQYKNSPVYRDSL